MWRSSVRGCLLEASLSSTPERLDGASTIAAVIALTAGIALLIGWYRGFSVRSLELAAAVFVVILAFQVVVLVLIGGDVGSEYWAIAGAVALGWVACVWIGSRARGILER